MERQTGPEQARQEHARHTAEHGDAVQADNSTIHDVVSSSEQVPPNGQDDAITPVAHVDTRMDFRTWCILRDLYFMSHKVGDGDRAHRGCTFRSDVAIDLPVDAERIKVFEGNKELIATLYPKGRARYGDESVPGKYGRYWCHILGDPYWIVAGSQDFEESLLVRRPSVFSFLSGGSDGRRSNERHSRESGATGTTEAGGD